MKRVKKVFSMVLVIAVLFSAIMVPQPALADSKQVITNLDKNSSIKKVLASSKKVDWAGTYTTGSEDNSSVLKISKVKNGKFTFTIQASYGYNTGELSKAVAKISKDKKTATYNDGHGFTMKFVWKNYEIKVTEKSKDGINPYCGLNVTFNGTYWNSDKLGAS